MRKNQYVLTVTKESNSLSYGCEIQAFTKKEFTAKAPAEVWAMMNSTTYEAEFYEIECVDGMSEQDQVDDFIMCYVDELGLNHGDCAKIIYYGEFSDEIYYEDEEEEQEYTNSTDRKIDAVMAKLKEQQEAELAAEKAELEAKYAEAKADTDEEQDEAVEESVKEEQTKEEPVDDVDSKTTEVSKMQNERCGEAWWNKVFDMYSAGDREAVYAMLEKVDNLYVESSVFDTFFKDPSHYDFLNWLDDYFYLRNERERRN